MDERAKIRQFEVAIQDRCAERLAPFEWGTATFRLDMPRVHDQNLLRMEHGFGEVSARELAAEADRLQRPAGLSHRKVVIPDAEAGQLLWDDFAALSWRRARHVAMVHRGATQSESRHPVREVESRHLRGARVRAFEEDLGSVASEQVAMSLELIASVVTSRAFTVEVDGEPVSWAVLYEETGIGEIDDVVTAGEHRRRGYGRAVVEAATRASLDSGNEITFLIADDEDWPKEMYARMGYETIDTRYEYTRM